MLLPCACHINYCAGCWDRALASSVLLRGQAQCPSCRTAFHADFDSAAGGLVFSALPVNTEAPASGAWQHDIYLKARPAQIELLQHFGRRPRSRGFTPGHLAGQDMDTDATDLGASSTTQGAGDASSNCPLCVCGAELQRVGCKRRMERMLEDSDPEWRARASDPDCLLDQLVASSVVTCDLCNDVATRTGCVWTCTKGSQTVLHLAAYDVCEQCFSQHTGLAVAKTTSKQDGVWAAMHQAGESATPRKVARAGDHLPSAEANQEAGLAE